MPIIFADKAWDDYQHWQAHDAKMMERVNTLIKEVRRDPFAGIGKPERLRGDLAGYLARRISEEHRMVYKIENNKVLFAQLRFHYY